VQLINRIFLEPPH